MDELENYFLDKLSLISSCRELTSGDTEDTRRIMIELYELLADFKKKIHFQKQELARWRSQLAAANRCLKFVENSSGRLKDCSSNIPAHLTTRVSPAVQAPNAPNQVSSGTSGASKPRVTVTQVACLTIQEFNSIPKYMKGRATYDILNTAVEELNTAIKEKYMFLAKTFANIPQLEQKKRYKMLKSQESKDTKGIHFVTNDDLKKTTVLKSETNRRNLLTILRHFTRIREVRGPGSIVRFAAIKKS